MNGIADGVEFKTFQLAFKAFVRFRQSLEQATDLYALETPQAIGSDREAGEIDPGAIHGVLETVDEYLSPLALLQEPPTDRIKFLNKRETAAVELLLECGSTALFLPLSLMRCETFGKGQGQITQALRRKVNGATLQTLIRDCSPETYADRKHGLRSVSQHMEKALLASLHALARDRNRAAVSVMMALSPGLDFKPLEDVLEVDRSGSDNVVMLRAEAVSDQFLAVVENPAIVGPQIAALMGRAQAAFNGLSRQGFSSDIFDDPDAMQGFAAGSRALTDIAGQVGAFVERLDRLALPGSDWDGQFETDKDTFAKQFQLLYGGP